MERLLWGLGSIKRRGVGDGVCGKCAITITSVSDEHGLHRYWEGRGVWNRLVVASRDAAEFAGLYRAELGADRVRKLGDLLCAFPLALQLHLQGQPLRADPSADLSESLPVHPAAGRRRPRQMQ